MLPDFIMIVSCYGVCFAYLCGSCAAFFAFLTWSVWDVMFSIFWDNFEVPWNPLGDVWASFSGPFSLAYVVLLGPFFAFLARSFWDVILGIFWGNFECFGVVSMTFGPPSGVFGDVFWGSGRSSEAPGAAFWETLRVPGAVWGDPWIPRRFVDASGAILEKSGRFLGASGAHFGVILSFIVVSILMGC